jgi:hypothetical protein
MIGPASSGNRTACAVGWLTLVSTAVYFISDALEAARGGFTDAQLWLTLAAEGTLPLFVIGLYRVQRARAGRAGRYGAVMYAGAYAYFSWTVIYALIHDTPDFTTLTTNLNPTMTIVGAVMVLAAITFAVATYRAAVLPRWTGPTLAVGVVLVAITLSQASAVQLVAVGIRDLAFAGMGVAAIRIGRQSNARTLVSASVPAPAQPGGQILAQPGRDGSRADGIDLYWLPLGAGGHSVRWNGKVYERLAAWHEHRPARDLYHAALEVRSRGQRYIIEMAPVWNEPSPERGVVVEGPVGTAALGRFRAFTYEVRCWRDGHIPDVAEAVNSPQRVSDDPIAAAQLLELITEVPPLTWGRDELGCGDMWNSNSLVAWLLVGTGHDMAAITPPHGGRAPGWTAGLHLAAQQRHQITKTAARASAT